MTKNTPLIDAIPQGPYLLFPSNSFTSRESMMRIRDPKGPNQSQKKEISLLLGHFWALMGAPVVTDAHNDLHG